MSSHVRPSPPVRDVIVSPGTRVAPAVPDDPAATPPDFAVQIRDTSSDTPCLTDAVRTAVQASLAKSFAEVFPGAYVDGACIGGPDPAQQAAAFGMWLTSPDNPSDAFKQARRALLDSNIGRAQNETIAF